MNHLLMVFLSMSFSGSLVILLLTGCGRLWKNRLSRQWQYYIWLVVIARLLLPFAPQASLADRLFRAVERGAVASEAPLPSREGVAVLPGSGALGGAEGPGSPGEESGAGPLREAAAVLGENLWLVWLGTALVLAVRKVTIYQGFVHTVKAGRVPVEDTALLDRLAALEEVAGVKRAVELWVNPLVSSPMLIGLLHPCIVLPDPELPETDFRHTVLHELVHCRRGDLLYKWLVQAVLCLHWFNPLVHFMAREINRACEFSCDEAIVAKLDSQGARAYGKTLLDAMAAPGKYREPLASVTLNENKALLKERLGAIMAFRKQSKAALGGTILLSVFLCFGAVFAGAYTGDGDPAPPPPRYKSRTESLTQNFQPFASFGVVYDPETDAVFYQGEPVKLFVMFHPDSADPEAYSFQLCYRNETAPGSLCLEGIQGGDGKITGIRPLAQEIADDLLGDMEAIGPEKDAHKPALEEEIADNLSELPKADGAGKDLPAPPPALGDGLYYVCMDGTQILERLGITGKDFPLEQADGATREWAAGLGGEPGAHLRTVSTPQGYVTYLYYTGGGRYPWNLREEDGRLAVNLYSQSELATAEGYCLLSFTTPQEYGFRLYLDGT